ncbi:MAG TPA: putative DNA-binding domain-containing protein, partial [Kofleriaceae bacterium]|nr:putative DNA-binding domain-containing protein [Kofleriaceae bacterium]
MTALDAALRRFHAAITGAAPLADAAELIEADDVDALARLHVYAHAYTARIGNVLAFEYPKLVAVRGGLGDLVGPYLRAHPPAHPSLREVGRHLAGFLADRDEPARRDQLEVDGGEGGGVDRGEVSAGEGLDVGAADER